MANEMHNSYNQFSFHSFLSALHVSNESSRSSSGARHNILYYTVWYNRYNRVLCNTVYYAMLLMMNDQNRSKYVEQTKNCGMKIDYKNLRISLVINALQYDARYTQRQINAKRYCMHSTSSIVQNVKKVNEGRFHG